jgi:hypothetical protein
MKKLIILSITILFYLTTSTVSAACFPEGCITISGTNQEATYRFFYKQATAALKRPDLVGYTGKLNVVEPNNGHRTTINIVNGIIVGGVCANGEAYRYVIKCSNNTINPPDCNQCATKGATVVNGQCTCSNGSAPTCATSLTHRITTITYSLGFGINNNVNSNPHVGSWIDGACKPSDTSTTCRNNRCIQGNITTTCEEKSVKSTNCSCPAGCTNGATNPTACTTCPTGSTMVAGQCKCTNGANNAPACNQCPAGLNMRNNICICANGATNPTACNQCPAGSSMVSGQCACSNGATPESNCLQCPAGKVMSAGTCVTGCNLTNVCGQQSTGVLVNGVCSAGDGTNINNSCITTFDTSSGSVNPNGSVEFSWKIADLQPNVKQTCGFVDLTTPTSRPIPGLQKPRSKP